MGDTRTTTEAGEQRIFCRSVARWRRIEVRGFSLAQVALLAIVLAAAFGFRVRLIERQLPYPGCLDEQRLTYRARQMLATGDLNPHDFHYPSLPYYITAAGLTVGYLWAASQGDLDGIRQLGHISFPYASHPRLIAAARTIIALLTCAAMVFVGLFAAWRLEDRRLIWVIPFVLLWSRNYLYYSYRYISVDIFGVFFALAVLLQLTWVARDCCDRRAANATGVLCGLTIACKYNLVLIIAPALLHITLFGTERKARACIRVVVVSLLTFLICTPYALLDIPTFLDDIGFEVFHYQKGHSGFDVNPGLSQLAYYLGALLDDFGWPSLPLALLGLARIIKRHPRHALVLLSYPVLLLSFMSLQRVHFVRNVLIVHVFYAMLCAVGLLRAAGLLRRGLARRARQLPPKLRPVCRAPLLAWLIALLALPLARVGPWLAHEGDSRAAALRWIRKNVPRDATIVVAKELRFARDSLTRTHRNVEWPVHLLTADAFAQRLRKLRSPYVLLPLFGYDRRRPEQRAEARTANGLTAHLRPIRRFGHAPVLLHYPQPVPDGDPLFILGRPTESDRHLRVEPPATLPGRPALETLSAL